MTAIRTTQAVASDLVLDRVVERLMRLLTENAGAQRGLLVLQHGDQLLLEACSTVEPNEVRLGLVESLETTSQLAVSVVQYVARSQESVVVADAASDPRFARDPYVVARRPKSLLCVAMQYQGRLTGVLYLENNAVTDAFSPARVQLLQFLAAQAAVAIENAKLYGEVQDSAERLRRMNERLEEQIAERTEELSRALAELQELKHVRMEG